MLYRPQLEPLSHEDFDAQYHLIAALDSQLNTAIVYLQAMRATYAEARLNSHE